MWRSADKLSGCSSWQGVDALELAGVEVASGEKTAGTGLSVDLESSEEEDEDDAVETLSAADAVDVLATGSAAMILLSEFSGRDKRPMAVSPVVVADATVADATFFLLLRLAPD